MKTYTAAQIEAACRASWSKESCYPDSRAAWTPDDPSYSQCGPTAVVVQRLMGGELYRIDMGEDHRHFFNLVRGQRIDFTTEQFHGDLPDYTEAVPVTAEDFYREHPENEARCDCLFRAVCSFLGSSD